MKDKKFLDFLQEQSEHFSRLADNDLNQAKMWLVILVGLVVLLFTFCLTGF